MNLSLYDVIIRPTKFIKEAAQRSQNSDFHSRKSVESFWIVSLMNNRLADQLLLMEFFKYFIFYKLVQFLLALFIILAGLTMT